VTDLRTVLVAALLLVLAACQPAPGPSSPAGNESPSGPSAEHSASPTAGPPTSSPTATPLVTLSPGRPYGALDVLEAMRGSRRPGGVPDQLEREPIVGAVAEQLWTIDGTRWSEIVAGGSCGPQLCTLEIAGTLEGAVGEDLYVFEVNPGTAEVTVLSAELRGLDQELADRLDAFARAHWPGAGPPGLLTSARWQAPPRASVFVLSYRSGGEEGSPAVDAMVDAAAGTVELVAPS
jgi:hypothetical protein